MLEVSNIRAGYDEALRQLERTRQQRDELVRLCEALIAYRDRVGPLGFQLEKADDYIWSLRQAIAGIKWEQP